MQVLTLRLSPNFLSVMVDPGDALVDPHIPIVLISFLFPEDGHLWATGYHFWPRNHRCCLFRTFRQQFHSFSFFPSLIWQDFDWISSFFLPVLWQEGRPIDRMLATGPNHHDCSDYDMTDLKKKTVFSLKKGESIISFFLFLWLFSQLLFFKTL